MPCRKTRQKGDDGELFVSTGGIQWCKMDAYVCLTMEIGVVDCTEFLNHYRDNCILGRNSSSYNSSRWWQQKKERKQSQRVEPLTVGNSSSNRREETTGAGGSNREHGGTGNKAVPPTWRHREHGGSNREHGGTTARGIT